MDLGTMWAAYSPLSGQTLMLNTEAVAILEILRERPGTLVEVCRVLASEGGHSAAELETLCRDAWSNLLEVGLLEPSASGGESRA